MLLGSGMRLPDTTIPILIRVRGFSTTRGHRSPRAGVILLVGLTLK